MIHVLRVCRHLWWKCKITVCFGCYSTFQFLLEKSSGCTTVSWCYWAQSKPRPLSVSWEGLPQRWEWASEVFEVAVGGKVSRWLLILRDEVPGPWRWERAPPLCGLAPLGGGGGSVSGPAWWGSAVGWAGWSQEAGVQGWSHWRARQVLWQRHVRQPCFCNVVTFFLTIFSKKEGKKPLVYCKYVIFCSSNRRTLPDWTEVMWPRMSLPRLTHCSTE